MKTLLLLGAGHGHLYVLEHFIKHQPLNIRIILITPNQRMTYSGRVPSFIEGIYTADETQVSIVALAKQAKAQLITERVSYLNANLQQVKLISGQIFAYDLLSIDVGGVSNVPMLSANGLAHNNQFDVKDIDPHQYQMSQSILPIRPMNEFVHSLQDYLDAKQGSRMNHELISNITIVGGGAGGAELILALAVSKHERLKNISLTIVLGENPLKYFPRRAKRKLLNQMHSLGIECIFHKGSINEAGQLVVNQQVLITDYIILARGVEQYQWVVNSGLKADKKGVHVNHYHQSLSHPNVFALGDACHRVDCDLEKSGVNAVRAGPIVANNLYNIMQNTCKIPSTSSLQAYKPRASHLYLINIGHQQAIGCWYGLTMSGRWVWYWKQWLDHKFLTRW